MLMISSKEFSTLCTCTLQRVKMESVGFTYTLRLAQQDAVGQGSEPVQSPCLHSEASADNPLQRLGLTLAEIALGKQVGRGEEGEEGALLELEQTSWARLLYAGAVQYCLSFPNDYSHDLQTFYEAVVEP